MLVKEMQIVPRRKRRRRSIWFDEEHKTAIPLERQREAGDIIIFVHWLMGLGDCSIPTSSGFSMFLASSLLSVRTGCSFDSKCGGTRGTTTQARSLVPTHVNMASSCLTSISLRDWKPPSFWQYGRSYASQVHVKCRSACLFLYLQRNMQKDTSMK